MRATSCTTQIATANAMASVCTNAGGCDFILNTGDNFYDLGITLQNDPQWVSAFQVFPPPARISPSSLLCSCDPEETRGRAWLGV